MPKFAKRHYEAIALAMQEACPTANWSTPKTLPVERLRWDVTIERLADAFARDNGQFKRDRFIRACEPGANVRARS